MMKTVTANNQSLQDYWQKQIAACNESGLAKSVYCREHNISYSQMIYWQKKICIEKEPALVPVKIKSESMVSNDHCICTLSLASGHILLIHDEKALSLLLDKWR